jgi:hypothetical protein
MYEETGDDGKRKYTVQQIAKEFGGHCCIWRSAHSSWSHLPAQKPHGRARMPGLSWFSTGIVEPALLL